MKKRRRHTLRNMLVVGSLASVALPEVRRRVTAMLRRAKREGWPESRTARSAKEGDQSGGGSEPSAGARRLEELTREELYQRAQAAGIRGRSEMRKEQLIEALRSRR